ncbi:Ndd1 protein [Maudiozyma humilis]|uniref:Ndd1 protein n=1 Tax=Maudiozyma humilis TaxID=51915 RepID=A0AAV5RX40_MAUHU|nr:Ndd1 protein [Kazachstania humilis]
MSRSNGTGMLEDGGTSSPRRKQAFSMDRQAPARLAVPTGSSSSSSSSANSSVTVPTASATASGPLGISPLRMSPPSLIMSSAGNRNDDTETNFFKALTDNLRYSTNSPIPHTQFPTPYSSTQDPQGRAKARGRNMGVISEDQQALQQTSMDSSVLENSINAGLYGGVPAVGARNVQGAASRGSRSGSDSSLDTTEPTVDLLQGANSTANATNAPAANTNGETLDDMNLQPSSVLQFGNTFSNEFLLASPEQLKEFLFESPAGFNLFHKTPAKTPLRFVTDSKDMNITLASNSKSTTSSSNLIHLFNSVNNVGGSNDAQDALAQAQAQSQQQGNNNNTNEMTPGALPSGIPDNFLSRTPLGKIDINLMFNQSSANSLSPSKKLSMSLTPYGRRVLNEMGTPFTRSVNYSNSALVDFQRARKDTNSATLMPPQSTATPDKAQQQQRTKKRVLKNKHSLSPLSRAASGAVTGTAAGSVGKLTHVSLGGSTTSKKAKKGKASGKKTLSKGEVVMHGEPVLTKHALSKHARMSGEFQRDDTDADADVYGSSPTTIQLNSSVTKSTSRLDNGRIPNLQNMDLIDERLGTDKLFDVDGRVRVPLSPTPKSYMGGNPLTLDTLKIPELPKMGSFKSDVQETQGTASQNSNGITGSANTNTSAKTKRVRKGKPKKPKFQVFVSSINKFNEPSSFVPMSPKGKKQGSTGSASSKLKRSQSLLVKNTASANVSGPTGAKKAGTPAQPHIQRSSSMSTNDAFYNMY